MNIDQVRQFSCSFRPALLLPARQLWFGACLSLLFGFASACGNKGALYLVPDEESLKELEQANQQIDEAAQVPGDTTTPATPSAAEDEERVDEEREENEEEPEKKPAS